MTTTVEIPADAVTETTTLQYTALASTPQPGDAGFSFAGHAFQLEAYRDGTLQSGFVFSDAVTITIAYTDGDVAGLDENTLELNYWDGSAWSTERISIVKRNTAGNQLIVTVAHLSEFAVFAQEPRLIYLPVVVRSH